MNDQPSRPTSPAPPADSTAAAPVPADAPAWSAEPGSAWGAPQPGPAYGAQPGPAYGAPPGPAYGPQPGAQWDPAFGGPQADGYPVPGSGGTSGFAIASLIFGILGGVLFGTIFGIVALVQIRKRGQTGRGMAIAGLTLSGCWILLIVIAVTFAIVTGATDDSTTTASGNTGTSVATPTTTKAKANGAVGVADLKPGHCIKAIKASVNIEDLPVVSCAVRHEGEVYAVFKLPAGPFPGTAAVQKQAEKGCIAKLKTYAPKAPDSVEVFYLAPLELSWSRDRGVTCIATDDRGPTTGSLHK